MATAQTVMGSRRVPSRVDNSLQNLESRLHSVRNITNTLHEGRVGLVSNSVAGRTSPGRVAEPGRVSPSRAAPPGRISPGRSSPGRTSPGKSSPGRSSPYGRSRAALFSASSAIPLQRSSSEKVINGVGTSTSSSCSGLKSRPSEEYYSDWDQRLASIQAHEELAAAKEAQFKAEELMMQSNDRLSHLRQEISACGGQRKSTPTRREALWSTEQTQMDNLMLRNTGIKLELALEKERIESLKAEELRACKAAEKVQDDLYRMEDVKHMADLQKLEMIRKVAECRGKCASFRHAAAEAETQWLCDETKLGDLEVKHMLASDQNAQLERMIQALKAYKEQKEDHGISGDSEKIAERKSMLEEERELEAVLERQHLEKTCAMDELQDDIDELRKQLEQRCTIEEASFYSERQAKQDLEAKVELEEAEIRMCVLERDEREHSLRTAAQTRWDKANILIDELRKSRASEDEALNQENAQQRKRTLERRDTKQIENQRLRGDLEDAQQLLGASCEQKSLLEKRQAMFKEAKQSLQVELQKHQEEKNKLMSKTSRLSKDLDFVAKEQSKYMADDSNVRDAHKRETQKLLLQSKACQCEVDATKEKLTDVASQLDDAQRRFEHSSWKAECKQEEERRSNEDQACKLQAEWEDAHGKWSKVMQAQAEAIDSKAAAEATAQENCLRRLASIVVERDWEVVEQRKILEAWREPHKYQSSAARAQENVERVAKTRNEIESAQANAYAMEQKSKELQYRLAGEAQAYLGASRSIDALEERLVGLRSELQMEESEIKRLQAEADRRMTLPQVWQYVRETFPLDASGLPGRDIPVYCGEATAIESDHVEKAMGMQPDDADPMPLEYNGGSMRLQPRSQKDSETPVGHDLVSPSSTPRSHTSSCRHSSIHIESDHLRDCVSPPLTGSTPRSDTPLFTPNGASVEQDSDTP